MTSDYFFVETRKSSTGWIKGFCEEEGITWEEWVPWFPIPNKAVVEVSEDKVYVPDEWYDCEECNNRGRWWDRKEFCYCRAGQKLQEFCDGMQQSKY